LIISSNLVVGVADPVGFFDHSFIFALNQFLDAAVVWASMIEVDLGEEFRIGGKGGLSSTSKALGLKNPVAGLWRFLTFLEILALEIILSRMP
jgi:hypothetical protein